MVLEGHYAKKQIFCQNQIIAWSHSSRFDTTIKVVKEYAEDSSTLLDYGCGDGTFLKMVSHLFSEALGTDVSPEQIYDCQQRLARESTLKFCLQTELDAQEYNSYFDIAVCMEVLEHCPPKQAEIVINNLKKLVKQDGVIIISVPIEIGPSLLIKQITRAIAGWLRQGDYDKSLESYSLSELLQMTFATKSSSIPRPIYGDNFPFHGHKGFNWRALRQELSKEFEIEQTLFSPVGWLGGLISSQTFLICRNRKL
jgi:2-polyprenyl-3-methyl-5-hydroxy-6-metoxy-1,4-benzoquinol methylase